MYEKNDRGNKERDTGEHHGGSGAPLDPAPDALIAHANLSDPDGGVGEDSAFHALIEQFQSMDMDCGKYAVRFDVLCDYLLLQQQPVALRGAERP